MLSRALAQLDASATGEVLDVLGHHADAADAVLELAARIVPAAIVVGQGEHGFAPKLVAQAPCNVLVVRQPVLT